MKKVYTDFRRGFAPILIVLSILIITSVIGGYLYLKSLARPIDYDPTPLTNDEAEKFSPPSQSSPRQDETINWKTYETGKFSVKYPPSWMLTNFRFAPSNDESSVTFYSPDYEDDGGFPYVTKGFKILLTVADKGLGYSLIDPNTAGIVGITETTWLGKKAQLVKISYEGANVRLETVETPKDLSLVMFPPVFEKPQFKTFEDNQEVFIRVANSLKLK